MVGSAPCFLASGPDPLKDAVTFEGVIVTCWSGFSFIPLDDCALTVWDLPIGSRDFCLWPFAAFLPLLSNPHISCISSAVISQQRENTK